MPQTDRFTHHEFNQKQKEMVRTFILLVLLLGLYVSKADGCIVITASNGNVVLIGNNEDWDDPYTKIWVIPSNGNKYGGVYFGYSSDIQGGMNEKGLVYDGTATPYLALKDTAGKERISIMDIMENCASIEDVLAYLKTHSLKGIIESGQLIFADKTGSSIIVDGDIVHFKRNNYQIATNFRLSQYNDKEIDCDRYKIAKKIIDQEDVSLATMRKILAATHQATDSGGTLYSNIYEPNKGKIYLYHFHNYIDEVVIDVNEYLNKGKQEIEMASLFEENFSYNFYKDRYEKNQAKRIEKLETKHSDKKVYSDYSNNEPKTPVEVILAAYFLANKGEYEKATSYLSSNVQMKLSKGFYKLVGGAEGGWDFLTKKRTLIEIKIINEEIIHNKAKVTFISTFKNGKKKETTDDLIFEDGHWRIN